MHPRLDEVEVLKDGLLTKVMIPEIQLEQISIVETSDKEKS